jgi:glucan phosphoethanolaminetransferase (alkaline phosphatase superfamily)
MLPRLLRCLASVLVVVSLSLPFAAAQSDAPLPTLERGVRVDTTEEQKSTSTSPAAVPHVVMALYAMLVLTIVCMPSRKA